MAKKTISKSKKSEDSNLFAFLAILLSIIGFVIALAAKKEDKYVMFYARQSLVLFFAFLALWILNLFLMFIPLLGQVISFILGVSLLVLWVIGLVYSLSGEMKDIPLIGEFAKQLPKF